MKVKLKTGEVVEVYKHETRNVYVNAKNCTTEYSIEDVEVISK